MKNDSPFLRNLGWLGISEAGVRLTRLLTAVVLARMLDPITFGIAALVLTINELVHVLNRNGIGAKIIQCDEADLDVIVNTAYRLGFIICISLFVVQCIIAYPLANAYNEPALVPMLQTLALVYLIMPFGLVQNALIKRREQMGIVALINGVQVGTDNLITAGLAMLGFGAWAIVLPKLLVAPIWVLGYRKAIQWRPSGSWRNLTGAREILSFGRYFLGVELLKTARLNLDNLIIARFLGVEALGLYYFARNAGLGFSLTLINAMTSALFPNLSAVKSNTLELKERFTNNVKKCAMIAIPLIGLQVALAPIYVPIVFGAKWETAVPILMLLCTSAIFRPLGESASILLMVRDRINLDFYWNVALTFIFILIVLVAAQFSLLMVAASIALLYLLSQPIYLAVAWRESFTQISPLVTAEARV